MNVEELKEKAQQRIEEVIQSCTETMRAGSTVYNMDASAAESIWRVIVYVLFGLPFQFLFVVNDQCHYSIH